MSDVLPTADSFRSLSGAARDEALMAVEREIRRLHALKASLVAVVVETRSYRDDGHRTVTAWVQAVTNSARGTAVAEVQRARTLVDMPALAAAFANGRVGLDQLRLLTRLHSNERCGRLLPAAEVTLVESARQLTFGDFVRVCERFEAYADPDGGHRDHERCRRNRHATTLRIGHAHLLHAEGDALTGDLIDQILQAHVDAELAADLAQRKAQYGDQAEHHPLARTRRQRRYDALVAIFRKAAGLSATSNLRPVVNIVTTESTLNQALGDYLSETISGAPVDRRDLAIAALVGEVRRISFDSAGRVTHLGRRSRLFTGAAREAVLLAFGDRCSWPGCDLAGGHIHIDHLCAWSALRGLTDPDNGGPICGGHNRHKHNGRFTVTRDHTGWRHHRPDGTEIAPRS